MCQTRQPTKSPRAEKGAACQQCPSCPLRERVAEPTAERIAATRARHNTLKTQNPTNPIS